MCSFASAGVESRHGSLLKDGLRDGRVEAQEYALWSLSNINDTTSKEAIVHTGGINPLITSLGSGKLSPAAQEHAAAVLSGLAPIGQNAVAIRDARGIDPLVSLLSQGNTGAKEHSAAALAQLALRAGAALEIAEAGAVSAFVSWLADPSLGPPDVAARALSEIALDTPDTQAQIAEEGAISPLVVMLSASLPNPMVRSNSVASTPAPMTRTNTVASLEMASAIRDQRKLRDLYSGTSANSAKLSNTAAGALATLAKGNVVNQITIAEEEGIKPLVDLLKDGALSTIHENATRALWHLGEYEDNQSAIARAGGIVPLVGLLSSDNELTSQYASAALKSLARNHTENQIALAKAGAIEPLVKLLGSDSKETQEHAVGALLYLASQDEESRNAVVKRLVAVLNARNAGAQMKSAEALAVLAARTVENRKAITAAKAIEPLVHLLGDGRRARSETPQERAAAVLADLARLNENRVAIVKAGAVSPLVCMLSSDAPEAQRHAAGALSQLAAIGSNKTVIAEAGAIRPLVALLKGGTSTVEARKFTAAGTR